MHYSCISTRESGVDLCLTKTLKLLWFITTYINDFQV